MSRLLAACLAAVSLAVAGCKNDFSPQSDLLGLRVLALVADPLELAPAQAVTVQPVTYVPAGWTGTALRWTFCPVSAGAVTGYACAVPACEVDLPPGPGGAVTAVPTTLIAQCLGGSIPPGLPEPVVAVFRYRITAANGSTGEAATRDSVVQIPQWLTQAPPDPNLPPVIQSVLIGGRPATDPPDLQAEGELPVELVIDPASVQTYVDAAGVTRTETMTGYFYTTGGTFSTGVTTGTDTTTTLQGTGLVAGQPPIQVWVVALDLRGGQAVAGPFTVRIAP